MELFRIARTPFSTELKASGFASRWNRDNQYVLYASHSRSLALLESVVHGSLLSDQEYRVMVISLADDDQLVRTIHTNELPAEWRSFHAYTKLQQIGSEWYKTEESLILKVPSVLVPQEYNYIIHTRHPQFQPEQVHLSRTESCFLDKRLLKD